MLVLMDSAFQLEGIARNNFFQEVMQTFGCTYICLWSYSQQSNCLIFLDGRFHEETNEPSSSSGSLARRLFNYYSQSIFPIADYEFVIIPVVPGLAFKYGQQFIEVNQPELLALASSEPQRLFYQEARIKTALFMSCNTGEIELGLSRGPHKPRLPEATSEVPLTAGVDATGQPSSTSSSLRSYSLLQPLIITSISTSTSASASTSTTTTPIQQAMEAFPQLQNIQLPITQQTELDAMTSAILAALTSPSSSSSSSKQPQQKASAFKRYNLALDPTSNIIRPSRLRAQSMTKRAISYYRRLNMAIAGGEYTAVASRPTSMQLHHKISERKRREKINENFQAIRSLLPPGTKRDRASLLIRTRDYLSSLKAQVDELSRRNQILEEAQVFPAANKPAGTNANHSSNQRVQVRVTPVSESTSEWRMIDVGVTVRGECPKLDLVIRILEFLKRDVNLSLISVEADTQIADSTPFNHVILRLRIQGNEWDESAFEEAVRRVVADLAQ